MLMGRASTSSRTRSSSLKTRSWFRAWTGNKELDGYEYLVFGQDGTGGYVAFWCVRPNKGVLDQPIVFFGSEGDVGVVASDFSHYLWLLAGGFGPYEAVAYPDERRAANSDFTAFAVEHAGIDPMPPVELLSKARSELLSFEQDVQAVCR
jgi:hypothetical protein